MPLDKDKLQEDILAALNKVNEEGLQKEDLGTLLGDAYSLYVSTVVAGPGMPIFTGKESSLFGETVAAALTTPGIPISLPTALFTALTSFWMAPVVLFGPPPIVGAPAPPIAPDFISILTVLLSVPGNLPEDVATAIADQLDLATKSIIVTFTAPPPPAGPPPAGPLS